MAPLKTEVYIPNGECFSGRKISCSGGSLTEVVYGGNDALCQQASISTVTFTATCIASSPNSISYTCDASAFGLSVFLILALSLFFLF